MSIQLIRINRCLIWAVIVLPTLLCLELMLTSDQMLALGPTIGCGISGAGVMTQTAAACSPTVIVDNANDSGAGSLRQAMADLCYGGTISFASSMTITLESPLIPPRSMTINGAGHGVTVSGNQAIRVFQVDQCVVANLISLTIADGQADTGAGIFVAGNGTLMLSSSLLHQNRCVGHHQGCGLMNYGAATIVNSTISLNTGHWAGAVQNEGAMTIVNSTFGENGSDSGGNLVNHGALSLRNSIIANSQKGAECESSGALVANVNNLIEDGSCSGGAVGFLTGDPGLGDLTDNGGDTRTYAVLPGSKALDAGDAATCADSWIGNRDQRGQPRPGAGTLACDIGAFELQINFPEHIFIPLAMR